MFQSRESLVGDITTAIKIFTAGGELNLNSRRNVRVVAVKRRMKLNSPYNRGKVSLFLRFASVSIRVRVTLVSSPSPRCLDELKTINNKTRLPEFSTTAPLLRRRPPLHRLIRLRSTEERPTCFPISITENPLGTVSLSLSSRWLCKADVTETRYILGGRVIDSLRNPIHAPAN